MKNEIRLAFAELFLGDYSFLYDGRVPTYKISRTKNGRWFINSKRGFHFEGERIYINLDNFPNLKKILRNLEAIDPYLSVDGGRISLSKSMVKSKGASF